MAVNIPTADSQFTFDPNATIPGANTRALIGTVSGAVSTKTGGNLPIDGPPASSFQNANTNTGGYLYEGQNGPWDVSSETKLLVWSWQHNAPNRIQIDTVANGGIEIRIATGNGTGNYKSFVVSGQDVFGGSSQLGPVPVVIDLNASGQDSTTGTFDNTDVQAYGFNLAGANQDGGGNGTWTFMQRSHIFDTAKNATNIVKFTSTSDFDDIITAVLGATYSTKIGAWVTRLSSTYFVPIAFQIGDTSTPTNFDCVGKTIVSPANKDVTDPRFRLSTQATRVYIDLRNNVADDVDLTNSTWVWGVASPFDFDVSNDSAITIEGGVFGGMGDFTLGSSVTGSAVFTLASGNDVIVNGAELSGSTINGDCLLNTANDLTNMTITGDLRISTAANSTLDFSNVTVGGSIFNDSAGNTLTINSTNGSSITAGDAGTGNSQTNIQFPVNITILCVNSSGSPIENARVYLKTTSDGELYNDLTSPSGVITFEYNYITDRSFIISKARKSTSSPLYKSSPIVGTITSIGFNTTITMLDDE